MELTLNEKQAQKKGSNHDCSLYVENKPNYGAKTLALYFLPALWTVYYDGTSITALASSIRAC